MELVNEILKQGQVVKAIHNLTFVHRGNRIEAVYSDRVVKVATIINEASGKFDYLTEPARIEIAREIERRLNLDPDTSTIKY